MRWVPGRRVPVPPQFVVGRQVDGPVYADELALPPGTISGVLHHHVEFFPGDGVVVLDDIEMAFDGVGGENRVGIELVVPILRVGLGTVDELGGALDVKKMFLDVEGYSLRIGIPAHHGRRHEAVGHPARHVHDFCLKVPLPVEHHLLDGVRLDSVDNIGALVAPSEHRRCR